MNVKVERVTPWSLALELARTTVWKNDGCAGEPGSRWKRRMLAAEHSPIRAVLYHVVLTGIPYWVSVHLVRHKVGVEHFVSSQRPDRSPSGAARHDLPQDAPVTHAMLVNAAALIAMSRKRLCSKAAEETRKTWEQVRLEVAKIDPETAEAMVPECVYRGGRCPEMAPCGKCKVM